jgi:hypothetical protein
MSDKWHHRMTAFPNPTANIRYYSYQNVRAIVHRFDHRLFGLLLDDPKEISFRQIDILFYCVLRQREFTVSRSCFEVLVKDESVDYIAT